MGALQGVTEFLPVSSSGHLVLAKVLLGQTEIPLLFDVLLHVATLVAVVAVFRQRVLAILGAVWRRITGAGAGNKPEQEDRDDLRLLAVVVGATVFTVVIALLLKDVALAGDPKLVSALFIVTGIILIVARYFKGSDGYGELGLKHALIVGVAQGFGVLPGISRSGITISASLGAGMKRDRAGEFSFVLSIPAVLGALVLELRDAETLTAAVSVGTIVAGVIAAFVVGLFSLLLLLRMVRSGKLFYFSFYLIPLGVIGLILL